MSELNVIEFDKVAGTELPHYNQRENKSLTKSSVINIIALFTLDSSESEKICFVPDDINYIKTKKGAKLTTVLPVGTVKKMKADNFSFKLLDPLTNKWVEISKAFYSSFQGELFIQNMGPLNVYTLNGEMMLSAGRCDPKLLGDYRATTVLPYHYIYKTKISEGRYKLVKHTNEFIMKGDNMCNITSLSMALIYGGWGAIPGNKQKEDKDPKMLEKIPRLPDRLGFTILRNMFHGNCDYIPFKLAQQSEKIINSKLIKTAADYNYDPHESVDVFKTVAEEYIEESDSGWTGTVITSQSFTPTKEGFQGALKQCFELNSGTITPKKVPVVHVCGFYNANGTYHAGGHFVCCSGLAVDEKGDVKQIKIDDPWPNSPKGTGDGKNGVNGNNVWHTVDEFFNNFINNTSTGMVRNTLIYVDCTGRACATSKDKMDDDTDQMNSGWDFSKVESFVQEWTCTASTKKTGSSTNSKAKPTQKQCLLEIDRYYDFYTGMTPYAEVYFRTGLSQKSSGIYAPVFSSINSIEHPFIKSINVKDNGVKTVTVELFDKDFGSYTKFALRKTSFSTSSTSETTEGIYSLDELIKCSLRNDFTSNNTGWEGSKVKEVEPEEIEVIYKKKSYKFKKEVDISEKFSGSELTEVKALYEKEKKGRQKQYQKKQGTFYNDDVSKKTNDGSSSDEDVKVTEEYLKFSGGETKVSPTNLRVRIGYADQNQTMKGGSTRINNYFKSKGVGFVNGEAVRTHRWWDATQDPGESWAVEPTSWVYYDGKECKKGTNAGKIEKAEATDTATTADISDDAACTGDADRSGPITTTTDKTAKAVNVTPAVDGYIVNVLKGEGEKVSKNEEIAVIKLTGTDTNIKVSTSESGTIKYMATNGSRVTSTTVIAQIVPEKKVASASKGIKKGGNEKTAPILTSEAEDYLDNSFSASQVSVEEAMMSKDQTTKLGRDINLMITGYSSTLTANGILYTLTGIETKEASLLTTRFLQRYAEIASYPEEVLYILMHMFNENNGEVIQGSPVRLLLMKDETDLKKASEGNLTNLEKAASSLVQQYDPQLLTEDKAKELKYTDTYNALLNNADIIPQALKKISVSLGSEASLSNYQEVSSTPPLYKSVATLMNEFCAACPPKKIEMADSATYDPVTNEKVEIDKSNQISRPLKWFSVKDTATNITYIVLYYRREIKPRRIRLYRWGPNLPYNTCVKQISIQNKSEFALLSGVRTFNASKGKVYSRVNTSNIETSGKSTEQSKKAGNLGTNVASGTLPSEQILKGGSYNLIANNDVTANSYDVALSSAMYEGTIDILGDPFYLFNGIMQPCTYPIRLEVLMPMNEYELHNKAETKAKHYKFGGSVLDKDGSNQRYHESTGYYVVKEIEHNISASGFTTKLTVLSYPNIEESILDTPGSPLEKFGTANI